MRLARLELHGFKSFPDRTRFNFGTGISCVVGPNGSGKSNVVDALKWCIGEQSAKSLRGSEMTDVIFAGSADRKPVGFAEVMLTLTTDDERPFPGEYCALHEVQVGRRLHRSGASEYSINQTRVRRRDVIELLLDSGIGNDLYSFIQQGQVDKMISASPNERRSLIDEAAGISRYKARRDEARERLEATAAQLDRAADVVDEMARHLGALEGQVVKAAQFRRHGALIRLGELQLALSKHLGLVEARRDIRADLDDLRREETDKRADIEVREADLVRRREEIVLVEEGLASLRDRVAELDGAIREGAATAQLHERRAKELRKERDRAAGEADGSEARAKEAAGEVEAADLEIAQIEADMEDLAAALQAATGGATDADAAVAAARIGTTEAEAEVNAALEARMASEGALASAERLRGERELQIASLGADLAEVRAAKTTAEHTRTAAAAAVEEAEAARTAAVAEVEAADAALEAARGEEGEAREALGAAEDAREAAISEQRAREREHLESIDRGRRWIAAAERRAGELTRAAEVAWADRIGAAEARGREAIEDATREAEENAAADAEALEEEGSRRRVELEEAVAAAAAALAEAKAAADEAERAHLGLARSASAVEAEAAEVRRQLEATTGASAALRSAVPDLKTLAELAPAELRAEWVAKLGDRAGWAVVRDAGALSALADARPPDATVNAILWPDGADPPPDAVGEAADLAAGVAGRWPVVGPGFRIDPGGFVTMGPPGALERVVAAERSLAARSRQLAAEIEVAAAARDESARALEEATGAHAAALEAREASVRDHLDALEVARSDRAEAVQRAADRAREAQRAEIEATKRSREAALAVLQEESAARISAYRAILETAQTLGRRAGDAAADPVDLSSFRSGLRQASDRTEAARNARERTVEARLAADRARDEAAARVAAIDGDLARMDARIAEIERQVAARVEERQADGDLSPLQAAASEAAAREATARERLDEQRAGIAEIEARAKGARDHAGQLAVDRASLAERLTAARERRAASARRGEEAKTAATRSRDHAADLASQAEASAAAGIEASEGADRSQEERSEVWDQLQDERERTSRLAEARDEVEEALREVRAAVEEVARRTEQLTSRHGKIASDLEVLRSRIDDRYQLSLPQMLERLRIDQRLELRIDPEVEAGLTIGSSHVPGVASIVVTDADLRNERRVRAAVKDLDAHRQAMAQLGEVNLAAPSEYRELLVRHDELASQRGDLEQSVAGIRSAIAKLNRMCRERFRETFDRVNGYFREVYPRLVGGGSARLALTDEEDLLETGVEIFVQPPGKRLQNLQLLSGGEKAMTAIALLIALFRVKPSPFCVLDEVDAPLDEANGARFNEMLKEMSGRSQFLVITHNRKTMECADTLYGITMARRASPGSSRSI